MPLMATAVLYFKYDCHCVLNSFMWLLKLKFKTFADVQLVFILMVVGVFYCFVIIGRLKLVI